MAWVGDAAFVVLWLVGALVLPLLQYDRRGSYYRSSTVLARAGSAVSGVLVVVLFGYLLHEWAVGVWNQGVPWWCWVKEMLGSTRIVELVTTVLWEGPLVIVVSVWALHGLLSGLVMLGHSIAPHRIISWKITELPLFSRGPKIAAPPGLRDSGATGSAADGIQADL